MQRAPYDFLVEDEALSAAQLAQAQEGDSAWTDEHVYALLPYSFVVLESFTEAQVGFGSLGRRCLVLESKDFCSRLRTSIRCCHLFFVVLEHFTEAQVSHWTRQQLPSHLVLAIEGTGELGLGRSLLTSPAKGFGFRVA